MPLSKSRNAKKEFATLSNRVLRHTFGASYDWRIKGPEDFLGSLFFHSLTEGFHKHQLRKMPLTGK